jgi:probable rRNA maturation factor
MGVTVQIATGGTDVPPASELSTWAGQALRHAPGDAEVTVRIVGITEGRRLNEQWRGGSGATNVLAFAIEGLAAQPELLGDVVVCADVANSEAKASGITQAAHWAHLVVHGTLHLLGYDHLEPDEAAVMEALESKILGELGYSDPYL